MYLTKTFRLLDIVKVIGTLLMGALCLLVTLPSLKYMVLKDYDVVEGECRIDISTTSRSSEANFDMLHTDERFYFTDFPNLDAYGKSVPYYCEVTITKDHMVEISYKIFDIKSQELLVESK